MTSLEFAREDWESLLSSFTHRHRGWLVSVEERTPGTERLTAIHDLPLRQVRTDATLHGAIVVAVDSKRAECLVHLVSHPAHIRLMQAPDGADQALEIDSDDRTTMIRLRCPALHD